MPNPKDHPHLIPPHGGYDDTARLKSWGAEEFKELKE
jgi:hypothetical protein